MIINENGRIEKVGAILMESGYFVLTEKQFLRVTPDGHLELWEGKEEYLKSKNYNKCNRLGYWKMNTIFALVNEQRFVQ